MITPRYTRKETEQRIVRLAAAQDQPHRRNIAKGESLLDPRLESPIGRLAFKGIITPAQYDAALKYRNVFLVYVQSISAPYPFVESIDSGLDAIAGEMGHNFSDDKCLRIKKAYLELRDLLCARRGANEALMAVVVNESPIGENRMEDLRAGLRILAAHFEGGKKRRSSGLSFGQFRPMRAV